MSKVVWAVIGAVPAMCSASQAWQAMSEYYPTAERQPAFQSALSLKVQLIACCIGACIALACGFVTLLLTLWPSCLTDINRQAALIVCVCISTLSPVAMLIGLPWENPYDGGGALPLLAMAIVLGLPFYGSVFTLPVLVVTWQPRFGPNA